jgi:hypothetical protein
MKMEEAPLSGIIRLTHCGGFPWISGRKFYGATHAAKIFFASAERCHRKIHACSSQRRTLHPHIYKFMLHRDGSRLLIAFGRIIILTHALVLYHSFTPL